MTYTLRVKRRYRSGQAQKQNKGEVGLGAYLSQGVTTPSLLRAYLRPVFDIRVPEKS